MPLQPRTSDRESASYSGRFVQTRMLGGVLCVVALLIGMGSQCAAQELFLLPELPDEFEVLEELPLTTAPPPWLHGQMEEESEPIETDRHDFTQSARTVDPGTLQIEAGYTFFYRDYREEIETAHTLPETVVRYGLIEGLEFRVRTNYVWQFRDEEGEQDGAEDIRWGFKLQISEPEGWRPESALRLLSTIPSGGDAWSTDRMEFGADYVYAWDIADGINLAGSSGFATNGAGEYSLGGALEGEAQNFIAYAQSAALGLEMTEKSEVYFEWYTLWTQGLSNEQVLTFFNIGLDYRLTDNLVIDVRVGKGLSDEADDFFAGAGGGIRF